MRLQQLYAIVKKIHNIGMWFAFASGIPIALTGIILEDEIKWSFLFSRDQLVFIRYFHGEWSSKFALVLAVMMVTGFFMWAIPKILINQKQKN